VAAGAAVKSRITEVWAPLSVPTKNYPALKSAWAGPEKADLREHHRRGNSSFIDTNQQPPWYANCRVLMHEEMLTLAAYPLLQDKKAPRPCMRPGPIRSFLVELLTLVLPRFPPVRGTSRRTDRSHRSDINEIPLQSCRQAQEAPRWSWYGRWSGTVIDCVGNRRTPANTTKSTTTAPTSISVRNQRLEGEGTCLRLPDDALGSQTLCPSPLGHTRRQSANKHRPDHPGYFGKVGMRRTYPDSFFWLYRQSSWD
jgi:hypothetical protein